MTTTYATTSTTTISVSASDVRQIMRLITLDTQAVCRAASQAARTFDIDQALIDVSLLLLNGIVSGIGLQIYADSVVIREYRFQLTDAASGTAGLPAGQPPLGYVPPGARIRLNVTPDLRTPAAEREAWFDRLGWSDAAPLSYASGTTQTTYGTFVSGGLRVQRQLMSNPSYDRPI